MRPSSRNKITNSLECHWLVTQLAFLIALTLAGRSSAEHSCSLTDTEFVAVVVDMDPDIPGCQSNVTVPAEATHVTGVAVWIFDPSGRSIQSIGYIGGIDRGIAFGHEPGRVCTRGLVSAMNGAAVTPVVPGAQGFVETDDMLQKGFTGPEVQYIEWGSGGPMPMVPSEPAFLVDVDIQRAAPGDVFEFYLLDFVTVWRGGYGGAFSSSDAGEPIGLDSGGDAVPDGTRSRDGVDVDPAAPVPPAAFYVDYVDGGGATVTVVAPRGDLNRDGQHDYGDVEEFVGVLLGINDETSRSIADMNCDDAVNGRDIPEFVAGVRSR